MNRLSDYLNSKNEKIFLELPNYTFSHSSKSQNETNSLFIGRKNIIRRLLFLIKMASSKTGVYLVAGNRGVGKSSLVEEVIDRTSLRKNFHLDYLAFLFALLFGVLGLQYITSHIVNQFTDGIKIICWFVILLLGVGLVFIMGHKNYLRIKSKQYQKDKRRGINLSGLGRSITAAARDFLLLPHKSNSLLKTRNVLKIVLILALCQIMAGIPFSFANKILVTHFKVFIVYLCVIEGYQYIRYAKRIFIKEYRKEYEEKRDKWKEVYDDNKSLADAFSRSIEWSFTFIVCAFSITIPIVVFLSRNVSSLKSFFWIPLIFILNIVSTFLILIIKNHFVMRKILRKKTFLPKALAVIYSYLQINNFFYVISDYIDNSNRIFLKINFGHEALNERNILRLISSTLTTEYNNYCKSWWTHTFYWRILAFAIILFGTYVFYNNIYKIDIQPLVEQSDFLSIKNTSQLYYASNEILISSEKIDGIDKNKYIDYEDHIKYYYYIKYIKTGQRYKSEIDSLVNKIKSDYFKNYMSGKYDENYFIQADKAINRIWCYVLDIPEYFLTKEIQRSNAYEHAPINYAFCILFFFFYLFGHLMLKSRLLTTHNTIKKQLELLNESITYSVEQEREAHYGHKLNVGKIDFGIKKKKSRLIADSHEIEKELQDILDNIRKIPAFMARPELVFVFDELDKVNPESANVSMQEREALHKETIFASNSTRERQAVILKILSNMKYFLSTANAKFIFIAGQEMYDMYLADIADRNYYFGSIFNDVIYVPSFLTDMSYYSRQYDITTLVEEYVCHYLIPEDYPNVEWTLKEYNKYLDDVIYSEKDKNDELQKRQVNMKKHKIIATLQQFIIYLSHTSKGAPKKMVQIFESFIENYNPSDLDNRELVVKQLRNSKFFLTFDYYDQYIIGMTSYLVSPVIYHLSDSNIQEHSDKLFISVLHYVDYLLKFHDQNFSRRSLDISPEIIEINRSPELKAIANDIVTLFENIHIYKPVISLYEFKFDALLSHEIFFISKMDERFSAQFNFSLDESLALKQYYNELLIKKQKEYKDAHDEKFVNSIASLQVILGDLHFLDDELESAALYYKDSIHSLRQEFIEDTASCKNFEIFSLFIRSQLKLAYLYEKRKQPEFAYMLYGEIVEESIKYKEVLPHKYKEVLSQSEDPLSTEIKNGIFENWQLIPLSLLAKLQILEKCSSKKILPNDIDQIEKEFSCLISNIERKEIRILKADFYSKIGDILYYGNHTFKEEQHRDEGDKDKLFISHYACMFYRRALLCMISEEEITDDQRKNKSIFEILKNNNLLNIPRNTKYYSVLARALSDWGDAIFQSSAQQCLNCDCKKCIGKSAIENGTKVNSTFWEDWPDCIDNNDISGFLEKIIRANEDEYTLNTIELSLLTYSLSMKFYEKANQHKLSAFQITKILNCFNYCLQNGKNLNEISDNVEIFLQPKESIDKSDLKKLIRNAIRSLYIAYDSLNVFEIYKRKEDFDCFESSNGVRNVPLQYIQVDSEVMRILTIAKELELCLVKNDDEKRNETIVTMYKQYITSPYHINYSISTRVYSLKLKEILNWEAYEVVKKDMQCDDEEKEDKDIYVNILKILDKGCASGGFCIGNTKDIFNDKLKIFDASNNNVSEGRNDSFALIEMLIADSIFCLYEILRLVKASGNSYLFNHGFFAIIYNYLANWIDRYEKIQHIKDYFTIKDPAIKDPLTNAINEVFSELTPEKKEELLIVLSAPNMRIDNYLQKFLGKDFREQLGGRYYKQQALSLYYQSIDTHNGGRAYLNRLEKMYFIKGDYDDVASHFNVAMERVLINHTKIYDKIGDRENINKQLSALYNPENYFEKKL